METLEEPTLQDSLTKYCTSARGHTRIVNNPPKAGYYFFSILKVYQQIKSGIIRWSQQFKCSTIPEGYSLQSWWHFMKFRAPDEKRQSFRINFHVTRIAVVTKSCRKVFPWPEWRVAGIADYSCKFQFKFVESSRLQYEIIKLELTNSSGGQCFHGNRTVFFNLTETLKLHFTGIREK